MPNQLGEIAFTTEPTRRRLLVRRASVLFVLAVISGAALIYLFDLGRQALSDRSTASAGSQEIAAAPAVEVEQTPLVVSDPAEPAPSASHDRFIVTGGRTDLDVLANDAIYGPVEVSIIDDPTGGRLVAEGGVVTYTGGDFVGDVVFGYQICSESGCDTATAALAAVPIGASRLEAAAPVRAIDTRDGDAAEPGEPQRFTVDGEPSAVALSVTVSATEQPGEVIVESDGREVVAVRVGGAGAMTTNTVILQLVGPEVTVRSTAGGHLIVDIVGTFQESVATSAGRFVSTDGLTVGQLVTAEEGRTATFPLDQAVAGGDASAVLAVVTADVGADGGVIRLGQEQGSFDQMLMWGPPKSDDRIRQGLVLLVPSAENEVALRYDGGSVLTLDVLGYFTTESAEPGYDGLLVATEPTTLFDGAISAGEPVAVIDPTGIGRDLFVVERSNGRSVSNVLPVTDGGLQLGSGSDRELILDLLAVFL